jgi:hypothetical protein
MSEVLTREALRSRINTMEAIIDLKTAASDLDGETKAVNVNVVSHDERNLITFVNGLPPAVVLAGLRAMQAELEKQL